MLSERVTADVRKKLTELQERHGSLRNVKCDDAFRECYPDAVDLHEWRRLFAEARHAEFDAEELQVGLATGEPRTGIEGPLDGTPVELNTDPPPKGQRRRKQRTGK